METTILTSLSVGELKVLLKEALNELLGEGFKGVKDKLPDLMDIKQAAEFLRLKITTLYEKTSRRAIPHIKKGGKLYFDRIQLEEWLKTGEVKTSSDIEADADNYLLHRKTNNKK